MSSVEEQQKEVLPHERSEVSFNQSTLNDEVRPNTTLDVEVKPNNPNWRVIIFFIVLTVLLATSIALNGYFGWKAYQLKDISVSRTKVSYSPTCSA